MKSTPKLPLSNRNEEISNELKSRIGKAHEDTGIRKGDGEGKDLREIDNKIAYDFAKETNTWIDSFDSLGKRFTGGNEHTTVVEEGKQKIYKSNNLSNTISLNKFFDKIKFHNLLFPYTAYKFEGFAGIKDTGRGKPYVEPVYSQDFINYVKEYVRNLDTIIIEKAEEYQFCNSDLEGILLKANNFYFGESTLTWIDKTDLEIKRDSKDEAFDYFRNCFVKVTKDKIETFDYSELKEPIWRKQIINRVFKEIGNIKLTDGEFYRLVWNVCRQNKERFFALLSALGYMLHSFKDKSNAKMIVFVDEQIGRQGEANGGTGKSLVTECLRHFKNVCYKGKGWSPEQKFAFEGILLDTDVLLIDDAIEKFPFEKLFTHITDDFSVEGKGDKSFVIPFSKSPKTILTTNYSLRGEGNSYDRRKSVNEFSDYYGSKITPSKDFGHRLFYDWDESQWQSFDMFMLYAVQHFLANSLQEVNINYAERELLEMTTESFIDLMDNLKNDVEYLSNDLLKKFMEIELSYKNLKSNTFNKWIRKYIKVKKITTEGMEIGNNKFSPFIKAEGKQYLKLKNR